MAQTTISARIDEHDKAAFDHFCDDVGLSTSAAISIFVKAVLRERRIPFEITQSADPFYSASNQEQAREGKGTAHELIETNNE